MWDKPAGQNILDSGAPSYEVYETKDGKFMAVGALEPQFYSEFLKGIGLEDDTSIPAVMDPHQWPTLKLQFANIFRTKTRDEWTKIFNKLDACVTPVLHFNEVDPKFLTSNGPQPSPKLSRTPAIPDSSSGPRDGEHTSDVLSAFGLSTSEISKILAPLAKM